MAAFDSMNLVFCPLGADGLFRTRLFVVVQLRY